MDETAVYLPSLYLALIIDACWLFENTRVYALNADRNMQKLSPVDVLSTVILHIYAHITTDAQLIILN